MPVVDGVTVTGCSTVASQAYTAYPAHRAIEVPMDRLDNVYGGEVGFIKIDVEGYQQAVLEGALDTRYDPALPASAAGRSRRTPVAGRPGARQGLLQGSWLPGSLRLAGTSPADRPVHRANAKPSQPADPDGTVGAARAVRPLRVQSHFPAARRAS
jgi:hypothetical protein